MLASRDKRRTPSNLMTNLPRKAAGLGDRKTAITLPLELTTALRRGALLALVRESWRGLIVKGCHVKYWLPYMSSARRRERSLTSFNHAITNLITVPPPSCKMIDVRWRHRTPMASLLKCEACARSNETGEKRGLEIILGVL
ncbi:hypothetical protein BaRGS_00038217 [Batillaria attramentaria]|uniref:F-box domain-containing protein n=1 Tax=Batillaria attramentaria TaxID=370345 RepID=A0ABD0J6Y6_9CAEN